MRTALVVSVLLAGCGARSTVNDEATIQRAEESSHQNAPPPSQDASSDTIASIPSNPDGTIDHVLRGELSDGDPRLGQDNSLYDDYAFVAAAGWIIEVDMRSDELDTYLWLIDPDGRALVQDDDGGDGAPTNSHIVYTATSDGTYTVRANAYDETGRGGYQLHVRARP
jgi:hypothetical protein